MRYRIIEQSPRSFQVQRKGGLWWVNAIEVVPFVTRTVYVESWFCGGFMGADFNSMEAAKEQLDELLSERVFKPRVVFETGKP